MQYIISRNNFKNTLRIFQPDFAEEQTQPELKKGVFFYAVFYCILLFIALGEEILNSCYLRCICRIDSKV